MLPRLPLALILLSLLLAGCETAPTRPAAPRDPQAAQAARLFDQGQYEAAAERYRELATDASGERRALYQLLEADSLLHAGQNDKAAALLAAIDMARLPAELVPRHQLVAAELALAGGEPDRALSLVERVDTTASRADRIRAATLKARAWAAKGDRLAQARALIQLDQLLEDDDPRLPVQIEILDLLSRQPESALQALGEDRVSRGWRELAALVRGYPNDPQGAAGPWREWQALYPGHPALPFLLVSYYQQQRKAAPTVVKQVAVLLPASGRYAGAARAIRNGLLAAWYADTGENRPTIRFYDSSDPEQVWPLLHQAADSGADAVIGPLSKESVRQIVRAGGLPLPVLALNEVATDAVPPATLYQYSLSPEDEARQVAIWAAAQGLRSPGILYPETPRGERVLRAFRELWSDLNREPVRAQAYHPESHDYSEAVEQLLEIRRLKAAHRQAEKTAGHELPFEPELPVDFIFVPGNKQDLLQLRPLIKFHHGSRLPVMTLSRVWKGSLTRDEAFDLGGLQLPEIPWLAEPPRAGDPLSRERIAREFPRSFRKYPRLIAMGMDAYALLPDLSRLSGSDFETLRGRTGELSLDGLRHVRRRLTWISLAIPPKVLGITPPLESIDTSSWESLEIGETAPADESAPSRQR